MKATALLALALVLCFVFTKPELAYADGIGYRVTPAVVEVSVNENGESVQEISIKNTGDSPLLLLPSILPLTGAPDGSITYPPAEKANPATLAFIKNSVSLEDIDGPITLVSLLPGQEKTISLKIHIKEFQKVSNHSFSIIFTSENEARHEELQEEISAESSVLYQSAVHIFIAGREKEEKNVEVNTFTTDPYPQNGPISFLLNMTNKGSEYSKISGEVTIKNLFNQAVGNIIIPQQIVLANQTASLYTEAGKNERQGIIWNDTVIIGPYYATLNLEADGNEATTAETAFFILPVIPVIVGFVLMLLLVVTIARVKNRL